MSHPRQIVAALSILVSGGVLAWGVGAPLAHNDGETGRTLTGCTCHGDPDGSVSVAIAGPTGVLPGTVHTYTVTVSGGPGGTTGGFNLKASGGSLIGHAGTQVFGDEITHADETHRSWTFDWQAPSTAGTYTFQAVGMSSDGSGTNGDGWNFYGGVSGTSFSVLVSPLVSAESPTATAVSLGPALPNPARHAVSFSYTLPLEADVDLTAYDVRGARIARLATGSQTAGSHTVSWNLHSDAGAPVPSGIYLIRLRALGMQKTVRLMRVD